MKVRSPSRASSSGNRRSRIRPSLPPGRWPRPAMSQQGPPPSPSPSTRQESTVSRGGSARWWDRRCVGPRDPRCRWGVGPESPPLQRRPRGGTELRGRPGPSPKRSPGHPLEAAWKPESRHGPSRPAAVWRLSRGGSREARGPSVLSQGQGQASLRTRPSET